MSAPLSNEELFEGCTIEVEHNHICIRNSTGYLLASRYLGTDWPLIHLLNDARENQEIWLRSRT